MSNDKVMVVVPWHRDEERVGFLRAWGIADSRIPPWLQMQHDAKLEGCGMTKNKGIANAIMHGADIVVVLDGDCFPVGALGYEGEPQPQTLDELMAAHVKALEPQPVAMFETVTRPSSRGTPYSQRSLTMPVAASMGFWTEIGDYCAVRQLAHEATEMDFHRSTVFGRYFPLCGMNLAFRPADWRPWSDFIVVPRFDDIWMGWLFQREAYRRGFCFNLAGPLVRHSRQSNVWKNLRDEAVHLEASETLWQRIAMAKENDYASLRALLPVP